MVVRILVSSWDSLFSGAMLDSGRVYDHLHKISDVAATRPDTSAGISLSGKTPGDDIPLFFQQNFNSTTCKMVKLPISGFTLRNCNDSQVYKPPSGVVTENPSLVTS